jgi:peptide/nickel transport system permease protein
MVSEIISKDQADATTQIGEMRRIARVMFSRGLVVFGAVIVFIFIIIAIFAPLIAPYDPYEQDLSNTLQEPSREHLLGTDDLGRDLLSRIIHGSRISVIVGTVSVSIAGIFGMGLGLIAGYYGRWIESIIMRGMDTLLALPPLVLILAIAAALGGGLFNVLIALGIGMLPTYCRLMCGLVISIKESDFILAARAAGAGDFRIMFIHLLPNTFPSLMVLVTLNMGMAILMEAALSFLGIGISPPIPTWGAMISNGYMYLLINPLLSMAPGICILLVVLGFNMVGDGLRDALDPRLRGIL